MPMICVLFAISGGKGLLSLIVCGLALKLMMVPGLAFAVLIASRRVFDPLSPLLVTVTVAASTEKPYSVK